LERRAQCTLYSKLGARLCLLCEGDTSEHDSGRFSF